MRTFRIVTGDGTFDIRGDSIFSYDKDEGGIGYITIIGEDGTTLAIVPGDVLICVYDISDEFNVKMEPEPMNKECACECQHD